MLVLDGSCGVVCWGIRKIRISPRIGWKDRRATERPFFKPISLDPILAKVIVNLTGIKSGSQEYLCDPMCGTGGILMEAALMDVPYVGIDFDQEMVSGCKTNLEWVLRGNNEHNSSNIVRYGNATDLSSVLVDISHLNITGFAFDPPYGKNSWRSEEGWNLLSSVLHSCNKLVVSKSDIGLLCLLPWPSLNKQNTDSKSNLQSSIMEREWNEINSLFEKSNWKISDKYSIHVHGSMSRLLIRATKM
jgi:tRNA (guanine10-N2)-dimethyltransferase